MSAEVATAAQAPRPDPHVVYDEYPPYDQELISEKLVKELLANFDDVNPRTALEDGGWTIFAEQAPKKGIAYKMGKLQKKGFPMVHVCGFAEFAGVSAEVRRPLSFNNLLG